MTHASPDQRAARTAREQYGLLTSRNATAAGLTKRQIEHRTSVGGWTRPTRGLYLLPGAGPATWRRDAMAGVLLGGPDARASHLTSAALHGLCRPPVLPHISVPRPASTRTRLVVLHRSEVPAVDRATVEGIPCTSASRAVVECAALVDRPGLEELVDQAICAERATESSIAAALARAGPHWPGRTVLTSVLEVWAEAIAPDSPAEVRLLRRLGELGAEGVVTQHTILDDDGRFVARVDVAVPEQRLAFEYDSDRWHGARRYGADEARHGRLQALGWRVEHVGKHDLLPSSTRLEAYLCSAITSV